MSNYVTAIGLDVHARSIKAFALNPMSGECERASFGYDPAAIAEWALSFEEPRAVYESGVTGFHLCRTRQSIVQHHATAQRVELLARGCAFHLHPVGLGLLVARIGQPVRQRTVVGEQQQAFAVVVQPSRRIDARRQAEPGQRRTRRYAAVGELAQDVERFVEGDQHTEFSGETTARIATSSPRRVQRAITLMLPVAPPDPD